MSDPWDIPPFPSSGDDDENATYTGVGRVITVWESIEAELSHLYAVFVGKYFQEEAYDEYYVPTFAARLKGLEAAAEDFFVRSPDQVAEGEFSELIRKVGGFSRRRHEVAHGVVQPLQWYRPLSASTIPVQGGRFEFCVVPPHYQRDWFDANRRPKYAYTSKELSDLEGKLRLLLNEVILFKHRFVS